MSAPRECANEHIAILYNYDPCPLCVSHAHIEKLEALLRHLAEELGAEGDPRSSRFNSSLRKIEYALNEMEYNDHNTGE